MNSTYIIDELKLDYKSAACFFVRNYFTVNSMAFTLISSYNTTTAINKLQDTLGKIDDRNITIKNEVEPY